MLNANVCDDEDTEKPPRNGVEEASSVATVTAGQAHAAAAIVVPATLRRQARAVSDSRRVNASVCALTSVSGMFFRNIESRRVPCACGF